MTSIENSNLIINPDKNNFSENTEINEIIEDENEKYTLSLSSDEESLSESSSSRSSLDSGRMSEVSEAPSNA